ncbi:MaoC family dehydratase [Antarcticimicrobium sediminis]|uniref:MaoC family dehydratase n=1 Tax=Antarcticimicrobium sediminis TaxID=2546227 RepID=A0A4R5ERL5_9RHOB|nr:MaoC family dehydratase [Antarcticimicrobium sediminis]TDE37388.1 MaoC family dehydratase [Antarcticimicrobium sediminis]
MAKDTLKFIPFESFEIGQVQTFGAYEVTKEEVIEFASKYDAQFFHLDEEAAKHSLFGGLCASGWHTCAMTMAMMVENMDKTGRSLGSPGLDSLRWLKPVYPGDVLSVRMEVISLHPSKSRPEIGIVKNTVTVLNQDGVPVMEFTSNGIFPRGKGAD